MALTFGKINRAASFNPTTAFPLDARSYFESYDLAVAAALTAKEAGDTSTVYYYGQTLAVVENSIASLYIIQPDGSLKPVGSDVEVSVNENAFTFTDGKIDLLGFADAVAGAQLVKGSDGSLSWVTPDNTTVEGLETTVATIQQELTTLQETVDSKADSNSVYTKEEADEVLATKANANDVYSKTEVYTKDETDKAIETAVANIDHLKRIVVDNVDAEIAAPELAEKNVIYMVKTSESGDAYKEYMRFDTEDGTISFEQIGDTSVDLSDYVDSSELETALATKADTSVTEELATLIQSNTTAIEANSTAIGTKANQSDLTALQEIVNTHGTDISALQTSLDNKADANALAALEEKVTENSTANTELAELVNSNSENIAKLQTTVTNLTDAVKNKANQSDLDALAETVSNKVDAVYSEVDGEQVAWTLLSPTNAAKLEKLSISEDGSVGISGTVSVDNVQGLADWITSKRDTVAGLFSTENANKLAGIAAGAQVNVIEAIYNADGETLAIAEDKSITLPFATAASLNSKGGTIPSTPGVIRIGSEFTMNADNALEVKAINVNKLVQTEDLLLNCGNAAPNVYTT